jgi:WD40 repeat protein
MSPLPDDSAVVLQNFSEELISTVIWQDGQRSLIINPDETPLFTYGHIYPTGQLLGYRVDQQSSGGAVMPQLIELDGCENDQCVMEDKPGLLAWSPDGRQTIVADPFFLFFNSLSVNGRRFLFNNRLTDQGPHTLYRTNGRERIPIGIGYEPFWIDNETYGYLRPSATGSMDIVIASTADDIPYILITRHTLRFSLPDDPNFAPDFTVNYVQVDPHNSERLFVVATSGQGISPRDAYVFSVDWPSRRFSLLLTEGYVGPHVLDFSPDGHWLISSSRQETVGGEAASLNGIRLYNLAQHRDQTFVTASPNLFPAYLHDWSADGQWLAMLADYDKIALALPGSDYYQLIQHDHGSCLSLAWINRQE